MASEREREVARAVAAMAPETDLLVIDGRTGRAAAHRPGSGNTPAAALVVVGPIDLDAAGGPPAIRPGKDGAAGVETAEFGWLRPRDRRALKSRRNRAGHAAKARAAATQAARGATSAPHGAVGADSRPGASGEAAAPHTRPRVTAI